MAAWKTKHISPLPLVVSHHTDFLLSFAKMLRFSASTPLYNGGEWCDCLHVPQRPTYTCMKWCTPYMSVISCSPSFIHMHVLRSSIHIYSLANGYFIRCILKFSNLNNDYLKHLAFLHQCCIPVSEGQTLIQHFDLHVQLDNYLNK